MTLLTIDEQILEAVQRHVREARTSTEMLHEVRRERPEAAAKDVARAALYAATDPFPTDYTVIARLFEFGMELRCET